MRGFVCGPGPALPGGKPQFSADSPEVAGYGLSSFHRYWQTPAVGICYARPGPRASVVLVDDLLGAGGSQYSIRPLQQHLWVGAFDFLAYYLGHLAESQPQQHRGFTSCLALDLTFGKCLAIETGLLQIGIGKMQQHLKASNSASFCGSLAKAKADFAAPAAAPVRVRRHREAHDVDAVAVQQPVRRLMVLVSHVPELDLIHPAWRRGSSAACAGAPRNGSPSSPYPTSTGCLVIVEPPSWHH